MDILLDDDDEFYLNLPKTEPSRPSPLPALNVTGTEPHSCPLIGWKTCIFLQTVVCLH